MNTIAQRPFVLGVIAAFWLLGASYPSAYEGLKVYTVEYAQGDGDTVMISILITDIHDVPLQDAVVAIKGTSEAPIASGKSDDKGKCQIILKKEQWSNQCLLLSAEVAGYGKRVLKMQYGSGAYIIHFLFTPHEGLTVKPKGT